MSIPLNIKCIPWRPTGRQAMHEHGCNSCHAGLHIAYTLKADVFVSIDHFLVLSRPLHVHTAGCAYLCSALRIRVGVGSQDPRLLCRALLCSRQLVEILLLLFMAVLWNRADHYIFALRFLSIFFFFIPRLISAAVDWMSTILLHMAWP